MPSALDLDDPAGYLARREQVAVEQADVDRAIEELLSGTAADGDDDQEDGGSAPSEG